MNNLIKKSIVAVITFLTLDGLWLGVFAKSIYHDKLSDFLTLVNGKLSVHWLSVIVIYSVLIVGIIVFPIEKSGNSLKASLLWGFIFGVVVYGTYGFTNHALVRNWPLEIALIDTLWGGVLCAATTCAANYFSV